MASKQAARPHRGVSAPRILRIGVVLGGNIIEERLIRNRETITIGQSSNNFFSIPIEGLPKTWPVFSMENNGYVLHCTDNMDGRLSMGGSVQTISQLKQTAKKRGSAWLIPLDDHARGKITVGAMTLLFQFVTAPPLQPRPRLPASVRGTLADRIEPRLAVIIFLSVLVHSIIGGWAYSLDSIVERPVETVVRSFQSGVYEPPKIEIPEEVEEPPSDEGEGETAADEGKDKGDDEPKDKPKDEPKDSGGDGGDDGGAPSDAAVAEKIQNVALVSVLTGAGAGGERYGKMSNTDQGASLDESIAHAKGKAIASTGGGGDRRQRGQNTGKIGTGKGQGVSGPGPGEGTGTKVEDKIVSKTKFGGVEDLSLSDLDPDEVVKRIRAKYLVGIKRCHERALKSDPKLQGRVTLRMTVGPTGRVTKASAKGFDPAVDACIEAQMAKWRFSAPKEDGKPTSADFAVPMLLKPGS